MKLELTGFTIATIAFLGVALMVFKIWYDDKKNKD